MLDLRDFIDQVRKVEDIARQYKVVRPEEDKELRNYGVTTEKQKVRAWQVPESTGAWLRFMVRLLKPSVVLELGTSVGYSTCWLGRGVQENGAGHVFTTEIFADKIPVAHANLSQCGVNDHVTVIEGDNQTILPTWYRGPIDLLFMDADKGSYLLYWEMVKLHLSDTCLVVIDNAGNFADRMEAFIFALGQESDWVPTFLPFDNGLLLLTRGKGNLLATLGAQDFFGAYTNTHD